VSEAVEHRYETARQFVEGGYEIGLYCSPCKRWTVADLNALIAAGRGDVPMRELSLVCRECRSRMEMQLRAPTAPV
jgi:hypothetical protein